MSQQEEEASCESVAEGLREKKNPLISKLLQYYYHSPLALTRGRIVYKHISQLWHAAANRQDYEQVLTGFSPATHDEEGAFLRVIVTSLSANSSYSVSVKRKKNSGASFKSDKAFIMRAKKAPGLIQRAASVNEFQSGIGSDDYTGAPGPGLPALRRHAERAGRARETEREREGELRMSGGPAVP